jgi:hypothetical protein
MWLPERIRAPTVRPTKSKTRVIEGMKSLYEKIGLLDFYS